MMNTLKLKLWVYPLVALGALAASGMALADDPTLDPSASTAFTSTKTRAQAIAEVYQARANRGMRFWSTSYNPLTEMKSLKTRDEVKADVMLLSNVAPMAGEDSGSFAISRTLTRRDASRALATARAVPAGQ